MAKQWRHAIVGVGVVGDWHARVLARGLPDSSLVALCDTNPDKPAKCIAKNELGDRGIRTYTDVREMLAREQIDVVHVTTPSGDHMDPVITSLEAGAHVICEKPLEVSLDRIDRMLEASKRTGRRLAGIFQNRWNEAHRALKMAADEGRFGKVAWAGSFTPWYRSDEYYRTGDWRGTWKLDGGGAMMNQSVHSVDLLQWIAGPVKVVTAYAGSRIHPEIEVEDTLTASVQFASGAFGTIMGSTALYPGGSVRIEIGGENGYAVSEGGLKTYKFRDEREGDKELLERLTKKTSSTTAAGTSAVDQGVELHRRNIAAILDSWERGEEAETSGAEARKAVALILAMYESARKNGQPVEVK